MERLQVIVAAWAASGKRRWHSQELIGHRLLMSKYGRCSVAPNIEPPVDGARVLKMARTPWLCDVGVSCLFMDHQLVGFRNPLLGK